MYCSSCNILLLLQIDYTMHPNTYANESYSDSHQYSKGSLPSLPDSKDRGGVCGMDMKALNGPFAMQ